MKKNFLQFALFIACSIAYINSNAQNFEWAFGIGDTSSDQGYSVTIDPTGNVIVGGTFSGTVDFDPGIGIYNISSLGGNDGFIAKYDSQGNFIWVRHTLGGSWENVSCVKTDTAGNIYASGNTGNGISFIEKRDSYGITIWHYELFHPNASGGYIWNNCPSIAIDDSGNVYGVGEITGTTTFSSLPLIQYSTLVYVNDSYVLKLNSNGNLLWVREFADTIGNVEYDNFGNSVALDKAGNIYATGTFCGTVDFDPDSLSVYTISSAYLGPMGYQDIYILKLNTAGNFIWAKSFSSAGLWSNASTSLVLNDSADLFITGCFEGYTDFDPGPGTYYLSGNNVSSFISRLDSAGSFKMAKMFRNAIPFNSGNTAGYSLDLDKAGNIYTSGSFSGSIDFDPDTSNYILTGQGGYISRLNQNGNFLSVITLQNSYYNGPSGRVNSISVKDSFNIYSTGYFGDTLDFDPGIGNYFLYPNVGSQYYDDAFVWKLSLCNSPMQYDSLAGCDSINISGQAYFNSGTYLQTFINSAGCDSTIQWHLTINKSSNSLIIAQACDSIQFNGINYFASGTYQQSFTNSFGCDSTLNLQLAINKSYDSLLTVLACDSFLYNGIYLSSSGIYPYMFTTIHGCDSIINLDLTINQSFSTTLVITAYCEYFFNGTILTASGIYVDTLSTISGCDSIIILNLTINQIIATNLNITQYCEYFFNGTTLTASGIYIDTLSSIYGCDSIIILNLTINSIDTSVSQNGITLTANATGFNYYWLNCNNNYQIISGATNQSFTPTVSGSYAVLLLIVFPVTCLDTSSCHIITIVNIPEVENNSVLQIYPDPFNDEIHIVSDIENAKFTLYETTGKIILEKRFFRNAVFAVQPLDAGIYFYSIQQSDGKIINGKIIKN
jgi:hypothetical protein